MTAKFILGIVAFFGLQPVWALAQCPEPTDVPPVVIPGPVTPPLAGPVPPDEPTLPEPPEDPVVITSDPTPGTEPPDVRPVTIPEPPPAPEPPGV